MLCFLFPINVLLRLFQEAVIVSHSHLSFQLLHGFQSNTDSDQQRSAAETDLQIGELLQQGNWETMDDYRMADVDSVTKDFLGRSAAVSDWDTLKFQEIDRLWQAWSDLDPKPDPETWLTETMEALIIQQNLPGLGPNLWMVVTPYNERYILAFANNRWAICPAENLQESA